MIFTLERTYNYELVRSIMTHPRIYPNVAGDFHPPIDQFEPTRSDLISYMLVKRHGIFLAGVCIAHPIHTPLTWEIHHCILPNYWRHTKQIGEEFERWLIECTPCVTAVGFTPVCNTLACRYALKMGMNKTGIIPKGYLKNGTLYDIMISCKILR